MRSAAALPARFAATLQLLLSRALVRRRVSADDQDRGQRDPKRAARASSGAVCMSARVAAGGSRPLVRVRRRGWRRRRRGRRRRALPRAARSGPRRGTVSPAAPPSERALPAVGDRRAHEQQLAGRQSASSPRRSRPAPPAARPARPGRRGRARRWARPSRSPASSARPRRRSGPYSPTARARDCSSSAPRAAPAPAAGPGPDRRRGSRRRRSQRLVGAAWARPRP